MKSTYIKLGAAAVILSTFVSSLALAATTHFSDQDSFASWFSGAVSNMNSKGIIQGYPDGSFRPNNNVNRAELAVMLDRYDVYMQGLVVSSGGPSSTLEPATVPAEVDLSQYMTEAEIQAMISTQVQTQVAMEMSNLYGEAFEAAVNERVDDKLEEVLDIIVDHKLDLSPNYQEYRIMAMADLKQMDSAPSGPLTLLTNIGGYNIYEYDTPMSYAIYVQHNAEVIIDPTVPRGEEEFETVERWNGPFEAYNL